MATDNLVFEQKLRVASLRRNLIDALEIHGERDIAIVLAAFAEIMSTVSDWNLQAERDAARVNQQNEASPVGIGQPKGQQE